MLFFNVNHIKISQIVIYAIKFFFLEVHSKKKLLISQSYSVVFDLAYHLYFDSVFFKRCSVEINIDSRFFFCVDNGYKKPTINVDFYRAPFEKYGIKVQMVSEIKYNGITLRNQKFLFGVDFKKKNLIA